MKHTNWRELVEILGIVCIVGALLLVALELRDANVIQRQSMESRAQLALADSLTRVHMSHAADPDLAKLYAKASAERGHLITATDESQLQGIARQYLNIYRSVQIAYDSGLIPREQLAMYADDLRNLMKTYPGLKPAMRAAYDDLGAFGQKPVFASLSPVLPDAPAEPAD